MSEPRAALEAIGLLPDEEIDIAEAALQLARIDAPDADWLAVRSHLSALARGAVAGADDVAPDDAPGQAAALAALLGGRHGYVGDEQTYDDPANANLIRVVERRRGLPVALGILWLHAAGAAGWTVHGVDFPGHFLLALQGAAEPVLVDPFFGGRRVRVRDLSARLRQVKGARPGPAAAAMTPMGPRAVLRRLQNNIKVRRLDAGDVAGALTCVKDTLRIAPRDPLLWHEAGLLHWRLEQVAAAVACFERFVALAPPQDAARARAMLDELRSRLN